MPTSKATSNPQVDLWPTDRPIPYASNPRRISDEAVAAVAGSIKEFGFKSPIIVDTEGVIINGHTRLRAAQRLGLEQVPVIVASDLTPDQVKAFRLADNRVAEFSEWDGDLLKLELDACGSVPLGFADFDALLAELEGASGDGATGDGDGENPYTKKVEAPLYQITGEKPKVSELCDRTKADELAKRINEASLPPEVRDFLLAAATRHLRFDYGKVAEFYANAPAEVQALMEESVLVIVDFNKAISGGFVRLAEETLAQYAEDFGDDE